VNPAALGFRAHSGWAALVVLGGDERSPEILQRCRVELADAAVPGSCQPYHAAEPLAYAEAEALIRRSIGATEALAVRAVRDAIEQIRTRGYEIGACGILLAAGRPLPDLKAILASHALIHTAEGQMYREALARAAEACGLRVIGVKERELFDYVAAELRSTHDHLDRRLSAWGRSVGAPWRQDEKFAALAAWIAWSAIRDKSRARSAG
jgi:hypothetical protein